MTDSLFLTTKDVSRLCRVSNATVKRWQQQGVLRSERTSGGHRRFRADDVARFQREQNFGTAQKPGDETALSVAARKRVVAVASENTTTIALLTGAEDSIIAALLKHFRNGSAAARIFDEVVSPALCEIGEMWHNGEITIAQEHLATRTALTAIHKFRDCIPLPPQNSLRALCCVIEGDMHEIPALLTQISLESVGWEVLNYGANMPLFALKEELNRHKPSLICVGAAMINDIDRTQREFSALYDCCKKHKIDVLIGGRGFTNVPENKRFLASYTVKSFQELVDIAKSYAPLP